MIRFGPSGIPLSCKGRTLEDGIEDVHNLGLSALEVQLVRVNAEERPASDEEAGLRLRDLVGELVVDLRRDKPAGLDTIIEKGDTLLSLTSTSGIAKDYGELAALGALARDLDVELSLHAPYYMDLADVDGLAAKSINSIRWGGLLAEAMEARVVSTHLGLFGNLEPKEALKRAAANLRVARDAFKALKIHPYLGIESSGRQEVLGSLEDLLTLAKEAKGVVPVINFAHAHARSNGSLREMGDFTSLMASIAKVSPGGRLHTHFSGVEHEAGNELRYTPIKKGDLRFEPLAEALLESDLEITLISSSPLLEHDAMYMKVILERILAKQITRASRPPEEIAAERELAAAAAAPAVPAPKTVKAVPVKPKPKAKAKAKPKPKAKAKAKKAANRPKPKPKKKKGKR